MNPLIVIDYKDLNCLSYVGFNLNSYVDLDFSYTPFRYFYQVGYNI